MGGDVKNVIGVWLAAVCGLCYCRFACARLRSPKWRLISIFPVVLLFAALPLHISSSSAFITAVTAFFLTWLASFKLLLLAFDLGPLASSHQSLPLFVAIAALPFKLKPTADAARKSKKLPLNLATEIPISAALVSLLFEYRGSMHPLIILIVYCCLVFLMIEILVELSSKVVRFLLGMELEPPSDEPYLAASLRDFWGRRWNLTVSSILREAVFRPARAAAAAAGAGREAAAAAGVLASFVVSGLMHELLFWYVAPAGAPPSWEMTSFFVLHGVCVVAESWLGKRRRLRLPWFVTGPATVGFVIATSFWLFFPPLMRNGADVRVIQELRFAGELFLEKVKDLW